MRNKKYIAAGVVVTLTLMSLSSCGKRDEIKVNEVDPDSIIPFEDVLGAADSDEAGKPEDLGGLVMDGAEPSEAAQSVIETVYDMWKSNRDNDLSELMQYVHFENAFKKQAFLDSGEEVFDYIIESSEEVNANLFAFTVLVKSNVSGDGYERAYNFAAYIDGGWYYINGVGNIPDELKENLDESKYSYT